MNRKKTVLLGLLLGAISCSERERVTVTEHYHHDVQPTYRRNMDHLYDTSGQLRHNPPHVLNEPPGKPYLHVGAQPQIIKGNTTIYPSEKNVYGETVYMDPITNQYVGLVPHGKKDFDRRIFNSWVDYDHACRENKDLYDYGMEDHARNLPLRTRVLRCYPVSYTEYERVVKEFRFEKDEEVLGIAKKSREIYDRVEKERIRGVSGGRLMDLYAREYGLSREEIHEIALNGLIEKHVKKCSSRLSISEHAARTLLSDMREMAYAAHRECESNLCNDSRRRR